MAPPMTESADAGGDSSGGTNQQGPAHVQGGFPRASRTVLGAREGARRRPKTVSFDSSVKFTERLPGAPSLLAMQGEEEIDGVVCSLSEMFTLALLLAMALLAPVGQEIAHVNDIILIYVGYTLVSFLCASPYSPITGLTMKSCTKVPRHQARRRLQTA
jgi:hypothetical protein